jgi:hypothetical protein
MTNGMDEEESLSGVSVSQGGTAAPPTEEKRRSALAGFMSVPVNPRFPIRRSTLLMVVAFLGFGTLLYFNPPASQGVVVNTNNGPVFIPGLTTTTSTSTTTTSTTTTTTITTPAPSTTGSQATSTTRATSTTTTGPGAATTTSSPSSTSTSGQGGGSGPATTGGPFSTTTSP